MADREVWKHEDLDGATGRLVLNGDDRYRPGYVLEVERAHLAALWLAILEEADSLEWASTALIQEAAIRCVMKIRPCSREEAVKLIKGEKL
jgi:hypothetical protein